MSDTKTHINLDMTLRDYFRQKLRDEAKLIDYTLDGATMRDAVTALAEDFERDQSLDAFTLDDIIEAYGHATEGSES